MLFLATHEHRPELCPVEDPTPVRQLADKKHIKQSGVKVLGSYTAPPEHLLFFILEADSYTQVVRYLRPMMKIGTPRIVPVQTLDEALGISGAGWAVAGSPASPTRQRSRKS